MRLDCEKEEEKEEGKEVTPLAERLIKSRSILLSKGVDEKMVESVSTQLLLMEADSTTDPITVYVNSPGGSADCGFAIYDLLRFVEAPIVTVCSGICASAAILIYLAGDRGKRFSLPNSRFLLHQPSTRAQGTASDLQITAEEIVKLRERYNLIVSEEVSKPVDQVTADSMRDFWLTAEEAMTYGLVNKVITNKAELN
jgi:ATP-dependent Clp protease protease subunit